jgi:predicted transcriptional regulator YdeE
MISQKDEQVLKKICVTFNTNFLSGADMIQAIVIAIDANKMVHPGLSKVDPKEILKVFSRDMKVHAPSHLRELTVKIFEYLMLTHVNPSLKGPEVRLKLESQLLPLNLW